MSDPDLRADDPRGEMGSPPVTGAAGTIYVDRLFRMESLVPGAKRTGEAHGHRWCHLWCAPGDEETLHRFAERIGMRREWFQNRAGFPHYDLIPDARGDAVALGATEISLKVWLRERKRRLAAEGGGSTS